MVVNHLANVIAEIAMSKPEEITIDLEKLLNVISVLKETHSCAAACIESQVCGATLNAKWAARELKRLINNKNEIGSETIT